MRRIAIRLGALTGLLVLCGIGCGHTPAPVSTQAVDSYTFRQAQGGVRVAADPFFVVERIRSAFSGGEDFPEKGLLPIHVIIENAGPEAIQPRPGEAKLLRPDGRAYFSLSSYDAFSMVKLGVGWWAVGAGVVGGAAPAYRNEARQKDIETRALREGAVPAGGRASGFLYFAIAEVTQTLAGHRLLLPAAAAGGREVVFEIPVAGSREIPGAQTPAAAPSQAPMRPDQPSGGGVIIRSPK